MNAWKVTWWDGCALRETIVPPCDAYAVVNFASSAGVYAPHAIMKIERMPDDSPR